MPGDCQLALADRRHARQVAGRECSAGLAGPQVVAVLPGDDQSPAYPLASPFSAAAGPGWSWPRPGR